MKVYVLDFDRKDNQSTEIKIKTNEISDDFIEKFDRSKQTAVLTTAQDNQLAREELEKLRNSKTLVADFRQINGKYSRLASYISIIGKSFKKLNSNINLDGSLADLISSDSASEEEEEENHKNVNIVTVKSDSPNQKEEKSRPK